MEYRDIIPCPIVNEDIDAFDCIITSDAVDDQAPEIAVPERFTTVPEWRRICRECPYHDKTN
ncbi:MAG: hypothetical protein VB104_07470 [Candidatus Limiplasma sp.]|nr:hypothetical protein [Candidatus Limiplasma sp.]